MPRTRPLQNEESLGAMKKTKLTRSLLAACSIVALSAVMYGCTGDGSENDLIATQGDLEDVTAQRDAALAKVTELEGDVGDLNLQISNPDPANPGLTEQLTAKQGEVDDLNLQIDNDDAANPGLMQQLAAKQGEVDDLNLEISNTDPADPGLTQQLAAKQGEVDDLNLEIDNDDPANPGLTQQLAAKQVEVDDLNLEIDNDDAANPGLMQQLAAKQGEVDQLTEDLKTATETIAALRGGTAPEILDPIRMDASDAADAADTASTAAGAAADAAEAADDNRATMQTGDADSTVGSAAARDAADTAATEAQKAADASTAAQNAANAGDATPHKNAAETARDAAMAAQTDAETARDEAEADAMVELKIDGTVKSVGDRMIDAAAARRVANDGMMLTGLQSNDLRPKQTVGMTTGANAVPPVAATVDAPAVAYRAAQGRCGTT